MTNDKWQITNCDWTRLTRLNNSIIFCYCNGSLPTIRRFACLAGSGSTLQFGPRFAAKQEITPRSRMEVPVRTGCVIRFKQYCRKLWAAYTKRAKKFPGNRSWLCRRNKINGGGSREAARNAIARFSAPGDKNHSRKLRPATWRLDSDNR